jgi:Tol biopolymer transport system component
LDEPDTRVDPAAAPQRPLSDRLDSWKKIAVYLKRDVTTVQRWERREGMPVHRHLHDKQGSVFAYRSELDVWSESRRTQLAGEPAAPPPAPTDDAHSIASNSPSSQSPARATEPQPATQLSVGAIEPQPASQSSIGATEPRAASHNVPRSLKRLAIPLTLLLLVAILAWFAIDRTLSWRNPLAGAKFSRLSDFAGTEQAAAISPNGKFVAVLASRGGRMDAWVGEVGSGVYRNLTNGTLSELINPSIRTLGFSADSSVVSIWTRNGDGTKPRDVSIYAAPIAGGAVRPYLQNAAEFEWSRDGRWLVYHTTGPGDPLFVGDGGAASARQIYVAPAGVHCHYPLWSTDGAFIYFVRGVPPNDWDIWRIRPSGADLERLTHHNAHVSYPVMLDRRTLVYLVTDADGSGPWIYGLDTEHPAPRRLTSGLETYTSLAASADGMRLVATTANPRSSLWRIRLGGNNTLADRPEFLAANALTPRLGPGFIVYSSSLGGGQGIWTLTQTTAREIWHDAHTRITGAPTISPDGTRIAFTVDNGTRQRLLALDKDGAHLKVLADSLELQGDPVWSPDGRSVVSAVMHGGEPRLTRIFLNGDPPLAMLGEHSIDPVWSPDGQFLVYSGADIGTTFPIRAAAADGRPYPIPSLILTRGARRLVFLKDPLSLIVMRGDIGHKDLWAVDFQGRGERQLTALPPDFIVDDFDISADGSELIVDKVENNSDMALIERPRSFTFGR